MNVLRVIIVALVALLALPAQAAQTSLGIYWTNAEVKAIAVSGNPPIAVGTAILRTGFYASGDSPATTYVLSACSSNINNGNGDDGAEIKANGSGCWVANPPPTDPLVWGARCNGTSDDTTAIQNAIDYAQTYRNFAALGNGPTVLGSIIMPAGKICRTKGVTIKAPIDFGGAGRYDGRLQAIDVAEASLRRAVITIAPEYQAKQANWPLAQVRIHNMQIKGVGCVIDDEISPCGKDPDNSKQHGIELYNPPPPNENDPWLRMMARIDDVEILSARGAGISAQNNGASGAVTINNVSISYSYDGVSLLSNYDWTIQSLKVNGSRRHAIDAVAPVNFTCIDCELFTSGKYGVRLYNGVHKMDRETVYDGNITFVGGAIDYNQEHGFYVDVRRPIAINLIAVHFTSNGRDPNCAKVGYEPVVNQFSDLYLSDLSRIDGLRLDNTIFNFAPYSTVTPPDACHHSPKYNIEFGVNAQGVSSIKGYLSLNSYFATSLDKAVSNPERVFGSSTSYTDGRYFNYEVTAFTESGTFKPREKLQEASVLLFGCGGGGGGGGVSTSGNVSGGGGGGGGARADGRFKGADIGASRTVTVCNSGGAGGASGGQGTAGGSTSFSNLLVAPGGGGGAGGGSERASGGGAGGGALQAGGNGNAATGGTSATGGAPGGSGTAGVANASFGGGGGGGGVSAPTANACGPNTTGMCGFTGGEAPYGGGGGGGSGGGISSAGVGFQGGTGSPIWKNAITFAARGSACGNGQAGLSILEAYDKGGSGGSGGGSCANANAAGGTGGTGGFPGGGGGGGGASRSNGLGGLGGSGGNGLAVVVAKYAD